MFREDYELLADYFPKWVPTGGRRALEEDDEEGGGRQLRGGETMNEREEI